jgi:hypothetical protein
MSILIWTTLFAVATACWFLHFRWDSDTRSGWRQISLPMILGASAYGFGTTLVLYALYVSYVFHLTDQEIIKALTVP